LAQPSNNGIAGIGPLEVSLGGAAGLKFTPRELKLVKAAYGRSLIQILQDDESDDRFTVVAWLRLRRNGREVELADMDDVLIDLEQPDAPDPTTPPLSPTSPSSVFSGE
jgi:hypothetical protein